MYVCMYMYICIYMYIYVYTSSTLRRIHPSLAGLETSISPPSTFPSKNPKTH